MLKAYLRFLSGLLFLFICVNAHADFKKAVDAYIRNDAESMLGEVNDSVNSWDSEAIKLS
jgi:hypothetical protein